MDISTFFAHAVKLETEAVRISERLSGIARMRDRTDVEAFYLEMAGYSRKHLGIALDRTGCGDVVDLPAEAYRWPDGFPPESLQWRDVGDIDDLDRAMELALAAERRGMAFYRHVAATSRDSRVQELAGEFGAEEAEHVAAMERIMGLRPY